MSPTIRRERSWRFQHFGPIIISKNEKKNASAVKSTERILIIFCIHSAEMSCDASVDKLQDCFCIILNVIANTSAVSFID